MPAAESTVLLVMDFRPAVAAHVGTRDVVRAATNAVDAADRHGIRVIYVRVAFRPGYPEVSSANKSFGSLAATGTAFGEADEQTGLHLGFTTRAGTCRS
jgi:nicotinamidase-related amidase